MVRVEDLARLEPSGKSYRLDLTVSACGDIYIYALDMCAQMTNFVHFQKCAWKKREKRGDECLKIEMKQLSTVYYL